MDAKFYTYRVFWSDEDQEFVGLCTEFPGMSWLDEDQQTAFSGIVALVQEGIEDLMANNESILGPFHKAGLTTATAIALTPISDSNIARWLQRRLCICSGRGWTIRLMRSALS